VTEGLVTDQRGRLLLIGSVAVAVFMARLDIYIVGISLPTIARSFHAGTSAASWVTMGYLLFNCGSMLLVGRIADSVSARTLFLVGYAIFIAGSLLCGLSTSLGMLIACRCVQGIGGAVLVILTYTVIARFLPADGLGGAMGLLATAGALGIAVGSPLGGFLTEQLSWQWVFFVNVPIGVVAMVLAWRSVPAQGGRERRLGGLDYAGAALSFLAVAAFVTTLSVGEEAGWGSAPVVAIFGLSVVAAALFLVRQRRAKDPLVAGSLLRERRFLLANAITVCGLILMGGNSFLMPFYLELAKGLSSATAGLVLLVYAATFMVLSPFTGRLADRYAPWRLCATGMGVGAAACVTYALLLGSPGLTAAVVFLMGLALVYALFMAANAKQVLESAPTEHKGAASAVFGTLYTLSLLLGVNLFETVYSQATSGPVTAAASASASAAGTAAGAGAEAATGWWLPGFSGAYMVGALACALALLLCFGVPLLEKTAARRAAAPELL
jgi:EmrB/QacA subfamily drug resistance transporter